MSRSASGTYLDHLTIKAADAQGTKDSPINNCRTLPRTDPHASEKPDRLDCPAIFQGGCDSATTLPAVGRPQQE